MPTWGEIQREIATSGEQLPKSLDETRRKYLAQLNQYTNRDVIMYATNWTASDPRIRRETSISHEDIPGFMEAVHGLKSESLDLILHSPGGIAEVTENIVCYLREKFKHIRVIVPQAAMSAATMLACSADEIIMGKHSSLGPIDPQIPLQGQYGMKMCPSKAIIDSFEKAKDTSTKSSKELGAYLPILNQYYPGLLEECYSAQKLSTELVSEWLEKYMFKDDTNAHNLAKKIACRLVDHEEFKSHSRHINHSKASEIGLKITLLEEEQKFQDLVLSVFHATNIAFQFGVTKIIENHLGGAFIKKTGNAHNNPKTV